MNKLGLIAVAGAALFAAVPAHADPLPRPYVGSWCFVNDNSKYQSGTQGIKPVPASSTQGRSAR